MKNLILKIRNPFTLHGRMRKAFPMTNRNCKRSKENEDLLQEHTDSKEYNYFQFWSKKDQEYVGCCEEFPSLSFLAPSKKEALEGIKKLVADVLIEINQ